MATCYDCFHWKECRNILESMNPDLKGKKITIRSTCEKFTPTTDVVEVVRCKDCKHCEIADNGKIRKKIYCFQPAPIKQIVETEENRFCSYGERKEDEGK